MILDTDKETIIKYLGKQPYRKIKPYLLSQKIFNTKKEQFSAKAIQNIINAEYENLPVENAIFKLIEIQINQISIINKRKNKVK